MDHTLKLRPGKKNILTKSVAPFLPKSESWAIQGVTPQREKFASTSFGSAKIWSFSLNVWVYYRSFLQFFTTIFGHKIPINVSKKRSKKNCEFFFDRNHKNVSQVLGDFFLPILVQLILYPSTLSPSPCIRSIKMANCNCGPSWYFIS